MRISSASRRSCRDGHHREQRGVEVVGWIHPTRDCPIKPGERRAVAPSAAGSPRESRVGPTADTDRPTASIRTPRVRIEDRASAIVALIRAHEHAIGRCAAEPEGPEPVRPSSRAQRGHAQADRAQAHPPYRTDRAGGAMRRLGRSRTRAVAYAHPISDSRTTSPPARAPLRRGGCRRRAGADAPAPAPSPRWRSTSQGRRRRRLPHRHRSPQRSRRRTPSTAPPRWWTSSRRRWTSPVSSTPRSTRDRQDQPHRSPAGQGRQTADAQADATKRAGRPAAQVLRDRQPAARHHRRARRPTTAPTKRRGVEGDARTSPNGCSRPSTPPSPSPLSCPRCRRPRLLSTSTRSRRGSVSSTTRSPPSWWRAGCARDRPERAPPAGRVLAGEPVTIDTRRARDAANRGSPHNAATSRASAGDVATLTEAVRIQDKGIGELHSTLEWIKERLLR